MTTIVGIESGGRVTIGADSQVTTGNLREQLASPKVFRNGAYLIACTGDVRAAQLVQHYDLPEPPEADLDRFMVREFVESVRETARRGGHLGRGPDDQDVLGVAALVAVHGALFFMDPDLNITRSNLCAAGSGKAFALGALHATASLDGWTDRSRVEAALRAAVHYDVCTGGRLVIEEQ